MAKPLIHCFSGSPFTWRALIVLDEKGIDHERNWIARMSGDHKSPEMLALNPRGKLPILQMGDVTVYESMAICHFLELQHPNPSLWPEDVAERAAATVRMAEADAYAVDPFMEPLTMGLMRKPDEPVSDAMRAANAKAFEELDRWEAAFAARGGPFLAGSSFSMADVALFPLIAFCVRCKLDLEPRTPKLAEWYRRLEQRPSVQSSWPPHWRESEGKDVGLNEV